MELFKWTFKKLILYLWGAWILEQSSALQEIKSPPFLNYRASQLSPITKSNLISLNLPSYENTS